VRRVTGLAAAAIIVLAAAACGSSSSGGVSNSSGGNPTVEVSFDDTGCKPDSLTLPSGPTKFHVKNDGASSISEFEVLDSKGAIVGEKESLTPGLDGTFSVDLQAGATYTIACPGGTQHPTGTITVAGGSSSTSGSESEAAGACVPAGDPATATSHLAVDLHDFQITPASSTTAAGKIAVDGTNTGTHPHEVVVVKGVAPADLPRAADGSIDEDQLPGGAKIGELEAFAPGGSCSAVLDLSAPGSYTLFCNVVGVTEGAHVKQGMVTTITLQ
jgi:uncharacterized cupredoxin-like copper-binding protein